jgi:lipopolysaccharide biosynthesis regulator YciM
MSIEDLKNKLTLQEAEILIDFLDNDVRTQGKYKCQICGFDVCKKNVKLTGFAKFGNCNNQKKFSI